MGKDVFCYSQRPPCYFVPPRREDKKAFLIFIHLALGEIKICNSNFTKCPPKKLELSFFLLQLFPQLQCSRKLNPVWLSFFWRRVLFPQNKECGKGIENVLLRRGGGMQWVERRFFWEETQCSFFFGGDWGGLVGDFGWGLDSERVLFRKIDRFVRHSISPHLPTGGKEKNLALNQAPPLSTFEAPTKCSNFTPIHKSGQLINFRLSHTHTSLSRTKIWQKGKICLGHLPAVQWPLLLFQSNGFFRLWLDSSFFSRSFPLFNRYTGERWLFKKYVSLPYVRKTEWPSLPPHPICLSRSKKHPDLVLLISLEVIFHFFAMCSFSSLYSRKWRAYEPRPPQNVPCLSGGWVSLTLDEAGAVSLFPYTPFPR